MMPPTVARTAAAIRIVARGGPDGVSVDGFARQWPTQLKKGQERRSLSGVGRLLGYLVTEGLLLRTTPGPLARFTVAPAGQKLLDEEAARTASTSATSGRQR